MTINFHVSSISTSIKGLLSTLYFGGQMVHVTVLIVSTLMTLKQYKICFTLLSHANTWQNLGVSFSICLWHKLSAASVLQRILTTHHSFEAMPKINANVDSPAAKMVRLPPRRGQIKAKIMTDLVRMVEEVGRAMCSKEGKGSRGVRTFKSTWL